MQSAESIVHEAPDHGQPQDVGTARPAGYQHQQLTFGPAEAVKSKPTIARLRDAMDAFNIRGTCRLVAYELLTYWEPGGQVFPLVKTLAAGLGKSERVVQRQLDRLERVGLWVRIGPAPVGRPGRHPSLYELRLPKLSRSVTGDTSVTPRVTPASPRSNQREVKLHTPRARVSCETHGRTWYESDGKDCFECAKTRMKAKRPPRKPRGGMPTYTDRPPRPAPPMTPAQTDAAIELALANGYRQVGGQWRRRGYA